MASCESAVAAVAPWDATLYSEFSSKFDRRIAALGPSFASRLEKLSAAVRSARQFTEYGMRGRPGRPLRPRARPPVGSKARTWTRLPARVPTESESGPGKPVRRASPACVGLHVGGREGE